MSLFYLVSEAENEFKIFLLVFTHFLEHPSLRFFPRDIERVNSLKFPNHVCCGWFVYAWKWQLFGIKLLSDAWMHVVLVVVTVFRFWIVIRILLVGRILLKGLWTQKFSPWKIQLRLFFSDTWGISIWCSLP